MNFLTKTLCTNFALGWAAPTNAKSQNHQRRARQYPSANNHNRQSQRLGYRLVVALAVLKFGVYDSYPIRIT